MCLNMERVMEMFSKELQILDHNTVKYMMDELQEKLNEANDTIANKDATIAAKDATISDMDATIAMLQEKLKEYEKNAK